jgi:hypothetical protein
MRHPFTARRAGSILALLATACSLVPGAASGAASGPVVSSITGAAPMNVFQAGGDVAFDVALDQAASTDTTVAYSVTDYFGVTAASGSAVVPAGGTHVAVDLGAVQRGAYTMTVTPGPATTTFAVVTALAQRPALADSPFAVATMSDGIVPQSSMDGFAAAVRLSGVTWVRDDYRWGPVNPSAGSFTFGADDAFYHALSSHGLKVLDVWTDAPGWTGADGVERYLPTDLLAAYHFARTSSAHFGADVAAWEPWNEPDGVAVPGFSGPADSADQLAAYLKAASIGVRDGAPAALVAMPGMGWATPPGDSFPAQGYLDSAMRSGIQRFVDLDNMHLYPTYSGAQAITPFPTCGADAMQSLRSRFGASASPLWTTEAGIAIQPATSGLSASQEVEQARYLVTSTVLDLAAGADKHFFFLAAPYTYAGDTYFGMLSPSYTPYRSFAAEAALTEQLGAGTYRGQLAGAPAGVAAHVFQPRKGVSTAVLWSLQPGSVSIAVGKSIPTLTDVQGRSLPVAVSGGVASVQTGPDPVYLQVGSTLPVVAGTGAAPIAAATPAAALTQSERVVVAQRYGSTESAASHLDGAYTLQPLTANHEQVEVANLNATPISGTLTLAAPQGWLLTPSSRPISVGAFQSVTVPVDITPDASVSPGVRAPITARVTVNGADSTPSFAYVRTGRPVTPSGTPSRTLAWFRFEESSPQVDASGTRWYADSSGNGARAVVEQAGAGGFLGASTDVPAVAGGSNAHSLLMSPGDTSLDAADGQWLRVDGIDLGCEDFTVEYFTKLDSSTAQLSNSIPVSYGDPTDAAGGNNVFDVQQFRGNLLTQYRDPAGETAAAPGVLLDGRWHHVAVVYRGQAQQAGTMTVYLDGVQVALARGNPRSVLQSAFKIGLYDTTTPTLYRGLIDEVRVSAGALAPSQFLDGPGPFAALSPQALRSL